MVTVKTWKLNVQLSVEVMISTAVAQWRSGKALDLRSVGRGLTYHHHHHKVFLKWLK